MDSGYIRDGVFYFRESCPTYIIERRLDEGCRVKKIRPIEEKSVCSKKDDVLFYVIEKINDHTYFGLDAYDHLTWCRSLDDAEAFDSDIDAEAVLDSEIIEYLDISEDAIDEGDILDYKDDVKHNWFIIKPIYAEAFRESRHTMQKDVIVDFQIPVSSRGKVNMSSAKKLLRYLNDNKFLRVNSGYFVKDADNSITYWELNRDDFNGYRFDCEVTETPEGDEVDYYNALYFNKEKGKFTNFQWESYKV